MGKRKGREQKKVGRCEGKEVNLSEQVEAGAGAGAESRFFACYLLTSMCPRFKGHTYIGFTVNPRRRIRQHNGEVRMGAFRTKKKRPWEMVLCIYGFSTNVSALQFEWAWQHPVESRAVRQAAASFKSLGGVANKIKLAYTMLTLPEWQSLNLTVNFFSTKYKMHSAGCPNIPEHMRVQVCALDELPCYTGIDKNEYITNDWDNSDDYVGSSEKLTDEGSAGSTTSDSSASSAAENIDEHFDWREELYEHAEEYSTTHREDPEQTYIIIDSPVNAPSSIQSGCYGITDNIRDKFELDEEFGGKLCHQSMNAGLSSGVEVIDVFTPPCYKWRLQGRFLPQCYNGCVGQGGKSILQQQYFEQRKRQEQQKKDARESFFEEKIRCNQQEKSSRSLDIRSLLNLSTGSGEHKSNVHSARHSYEGNAFTPHNQMLQRSSVIQTNEVISVGSLQHKEGTSPSSQDYAACPKKRLE
nr:uncharacterized protein LOC104096065 isoform X2 [Nicotiana tomentosiformis]